MRKFATICCLFISGYIYSSEPRPSFIPQASAKFDSIWVDYGITENNVLGMRIHLKFSTYGMKDMDAYVAIYYEYNDDLAGYLKDKNSKYNSTAGDVAVYQSIKPAYDPAVYSDLQLFMPYAELDLEPGVYDLTMDVKIIYKAGGELSRLTYYDFEYRKPGSPADDVSGNETDATFEDLWVDYDVTEDGKKGMRIHVKFTAMNMLNIDGYVAVYFELKNGEKISGTEGYKSKSGQLAVYKSIKPAYKEAVYKDLQLFMPYSALTNAPKGKQDLKLDVDIILKNGDMVKHLKDYDFWFTH